MSLQGRHQWAGQLTGENFRLVAGLVKDLLSQGHFTRVDVNSGMWDNEPAARSGLTLEGFQVDEPSHIYGAGGFTISDGEWTTGVHTQFQTNQESMDAPERDRISIAISDRQCCIRSFAPAGCRLYWLWTLEGER